MTGVCHLVRLHVPLMEVVIGVLSPCVALLEGHELALVRSKGDLAALPVLPTLRRDGVCYREAHVAPLLRSALFIAMPLSHIYV